jgi:hypothetical protein
MTRCFSLKQWIAAGRQHGRPSNKTSSVVISSVCGGHRMVDAGDSVRAAEMIPLDA